MEKSNGFKTLGGRVLVALLTRQVFTPGTLGEFLQEKPKRVGSELSHLYCNSFLARLLERKEISPNRFSYQLIKGADFTEDDFREIINVSYGQYRGGKYSGLSKALRHNTGKSKTKRNYTPVENRF